MEANLIKISDLKVNDIILDNDGLSQIVKDIKIISKKVVITTNYLENDFYKAKDTTRTKNLNTTCYKLY
jgi:hypothetical protein